LLISPRSSFPDSSLSYQSPPAPAAPGAAAAKTATGYGLESILPDATVSDIGRKMVPYLRNNDFDGAMTLAVGQTAQIIAQDTGVTLTPLTRRAARQPAQIGLGKLLIFGIGLILLLIFLARAGGSGIIGFLLGMFLGGGGRSRWQ